MFPPDQLRAILERGLRAKSLLENDAFNGLIEEQTSYHLAALVAAPPGPSGADAVNYHHAQQHALTQLMATLQGHISAAENVERAIGNDPEADEEI